MRENEIRIGGLSMGMFSIFEPAEPRYHRFIDQSVAAWRLASKKIGSAAFENPRSVIQRTVSITTGGSNAEHLRRADCAIPPIQERMIPIIHRRARVNSYFHGVPPYNPEELERRSVVRSRPMMSASEVRMRTVEESGRFGYSTPEEVAEIQRRFHNPELEHAMELARQEMARRRVYSMQFVRNPDGSFEPHVD